MNQWIDNQSLLHKIILAHFLISIIEYEQSQLFWEYNSINT